VKNTEIYTKSKYTKSGIREIVRIVFNPYDRPANEIMKEWVTKENWYKCCAYNIKIRR